MISLRAFSRLLWALVLISLPVTSFRYLPFMGSGTVVRPMAILPLAVLLLVLAIQIMRGDLKFRWPGSLILLLWFGLFLLAATAIGALFSPIPLRGADYWDRAIRAFITLAIGAAFFVAAICMNKKEEDLIFTIRWLLVGLVAHLLWGAVQFWGLNNGYRAELKEIQEIFSVRGLVKNKRISGFAFEPSWLASQLATLYIPWLVAGLLTGFRVLNFQRLPKLMYQLLEPLLLVASLTAVFMTYSRSGLLVTFVALIITTLLAGRGWLAGGWGWFKAGFNFQPGVGFWNKMRLRAARLLILLTVLSVVVGASVFLADKGYIARLWTSDITDFWEYVTQASLGPRVAYTVGAMRAFDMNPLTGVGLGASGFHIYAGIPDEVLMGVPEIADALSPESGLFPNPKNLVVRLLAEGGLVGLFLFLSFWLYLLADGLNVLRSKTPYLKFLGASAIFTITALGLMAFSQDSFAMPELWLNLGILAGIATLYKG